MLNAASPPLPSLRHAAALTLLALGLGPTPHAHAHDAHATSTSTSTNDSSTDATSTDATSTDRRSIDHTQPQAPAAPTPATPGGLSQLPGLNLLTERSPEDFFGAISLPGQDVPFLREGATRLNLQSAVAYDFSDAVDLNPINVGLSHFIVDSVEIGFEVGAWYFLQDDEDAGGISTHLLFRFHLLDSTMFAADPTNDPTWSAFADLGIGLLGTTSDVPAGGTSFNFMPRIGAGFNYHLGPGDTWLTLGLRWHHISNARLISQDNNPARDGLLFFAGISVPF